MSGILNALIGSRTSAISLVVSGALSGSAIDGADVTISFPTLLENDVVFICGGSAKARAGYVPGPTTAGYTSLASSTTSDVSWKRMGASPDTSVTGRGTANTSDSAVYCVFCLRGVVTSGAPTDATTTTATATSTNPDGASITTATNGAWVLVFALSNVLDSSITAPSGYSNFVQNTVDDTNDASGAGATKFIGSFGAEDPPAFTTWASGLWEAYTVAIKQA